MCFTLSNKFFGVDRGPRDNSDPHGSLDRPTQKVRSHSTHRQQQQRDRCHLKKKSVVRHISSSANCLVHSRICARVAEWMAPTQSSANPSFHPLWSFSRECS